LTYYLLFVIFNSINKELNSLTDPFKKGDFISVQVTCRFAGLQVCRKDKPVQPFLKITKPDFYEDSIK
jgi:hypothetical protein